MTDRIDLGQDPWQAIPRRVLRDPALSPRAKGGLVTLLSHEEGWVRSAIATLMRENSCGREQAQAIMRELVAAGYAELRKVRGERGRFTSTYVVRAWPSSSGRSTSRSPSTGEPSTVTPPVEEEPRDEEPHEDLPPRSAAGVQKLGKTPKPNPIFDALAELHGGTSKLTPEMKRTVGVKLASIRRATPNVTPAEIRRRAANYRRLWWNRERTPPTAAALAKYWADCDMPEATGPISSGRHISSLTDAELEELMG